MVMEECHVCYCIDEGFEKYAIASIISLLKNSGINPKIHIICNKKTDKKILGIAEKMFNAKFRYYFGSDKKFIGLPKLGSYSVYYRLLIPSLLPKNVNKVLYLDCDTLIEKSINKLFSTDLSGKALAAAHNLTFIKNSMKSFNKRLGMPKNKNYFNSGVMLLNLKYIRSNGLFSKVINFMKKNAKKIVMHDQDGLNAVLCKDWIKLSNSYNYMLNFNPIKAKKNSMRIIHFAGLKPEIYIILNQGNKYSKKYFYYLSLANLPKTNAKTKINYFKRLYESILRQFK